MLKGKKLLLALLLPVFVLGLCFAAFALDEDDFIIIDGEHFTPEEWAAKQEQMAAMKVMKTDAEQPIIAQAPDAVLKYNPNQQNNLDKSAPATNLLFEDFEGGVVPPTGWTADVQNAAYTWKIATSSPYNGSNYTNCEYDPALSPQDEWLISPVVDLTTGGTTWFLEFHWYMSYYWGVDPNDNYDLEVWISTDGGATFGTMLWTEPTTTFDSWVWYDVTIDLTPYLTETNVAFGFRYVGTDGAEGAFDFISVNDQAPPVGRCCYGDPAAASCAEESQSACEARPDWLSWDEGLDCTNNPCPTLPDNDQCADAELVAGPFPQTVTGSTINSTVDCPGLLDWQAVWYYFENPYSCANVVIDWCGTSPDLVTVGVIVMDDCACD
nr:hypothetical protein [candidate division Zixibacteria bacterium]NIW43952.1 hypothetical protein [Gammaproteobacteria bacterium]NIX56922.1 hypothetical protein [candidate division Zixibacteria bacterium]